MLQISLFNSHHFVYCFCSNSLLQSLTFGDIERIYKMSFTKPADNGMLQEFVFLLNNRMERFKTVPAHILAFYLFLQVLRFSYNSIKPIEKLLDDILKFFRCLRSSRLNYRQSRIENTQLGKYH